MVCKPRSEEHFCLFAGGERERKKGVLLFSDVYATDPGVWMEANWLIARLVQELHRQLVKR